MHLVFFLEEPSAEAALNNLLPRMLPAEATWELHPFQGKHDLLHKLPSRLRAYARWIPRDFGLVVLLDQDLQDCRVLKDQLESMAASAGLATKTNPGPGGWFNVLTRIAIEEIEAWFFGDAQALSAAFPRLGRGRLRQAWLSNPDAIQGGTWETLERVLQRAGYFPSGLAKIALARDVSERMDPARNTSQSFQRFWQGLEALVSSLS